ncbi:MAG: type II 3-dehydroquinate dehydratase [Pseudomonadota bacterium]
MKILILNGPNLNLLGTRQPEVYGSTTLREIAHMCHAKAESLGVQIGFEQSNHEGELIDWIHGAKGVYEAIIINAGAYTHTSIAIMDALLSVEIPTVELHLSDITKREKFRQISYIEKASFAQIMGHGPDGYPLAIEATVEHLRSA